MKNGGTTWFLRFCMQNAPRTAEGGKRFGVMPGKFAIANVDKSTNEVYNARKPMFLGRTHVWIALKPS